MRCTGRCEEGDEEEEAEEEERLLWILNVKEELEYFHVIEKCKCMLYFVKRFVTRGLVTFTFPF